jgi:hypothetical protein
MPAATPNPMSANSQLSARRRQHYVEREAQEALLPRIYRTTCWRCGVNSQIGCKHMREADD